MHFFYLSYQILSNFMSFGRLFWAPYERGLSCNRTTKKIYRYWILFQAFEFESINKPSLMIKDSFNQLLSYFNIRYIFTVDISRYFYALSATKRDFILQTIIA